MGSFPSMNTQSVIISKSELTNPSTGGFKVGFFKFARAGALVDGYCSVRTAIGAGTISVDLLDSGTDGNTGNTTIGSIGTVTALSANQPAAFSAFGAVDAGDVITIQVKGDGTLDCVDFCVQLDYIYGTPVAEA